MTSGGGLCRRARARATGPHALRPGSVKAVSPAAPSSRARAADPAGGEAPCDQNRRAQNDGAAAVYGASAQDHGDGREQPQERGATTGPAAPSGWSGAQQRRPAWGMREGAPRPTRRRPPPRGTTTRRGAGVPGHAKNWIRTRAGGRGGRRPAVRLAGAAKGALSARPGRRASSGRAPLPARPHVGGPARAWPPSGSNGLLRGRVPSRRYPPPRHFPGTRMPPFPRSRVRSRTYHGVSRALVLFASRFCRTHAGVMSFRGRGVPVRPGTSPSEVSKSSAVATYGSTFDDGRRSSR